MQQCLHWIIVSTICSVLQTSKVDTHQCNVLVKEISDILAYISVDILILYWIQKIFFYFLSVNNSSYFCVYNLHTTFDSHLLLQRTALISLLSQSMLCLGSSFCFQSSLILFVLSSVIYVQPCLHFCSRSYLSVWG